MKKGYIVAGAVLLLLIIGGIFVRFIIGGSEDTWIKDSKGVWIKHGAPSETPDYVAEQQEAISCALGLYEQKMAEGMNFSSQCLGTCGDYSVDIVHVPRTAEDDLAESQCQDYLNSQTIYFIELDKEGEIVRIE